MSVAGPTGHRPAWTEVDLDAIAHNAAVLRRVCPGSSLCAVVKADAYGHGSAPVAKAAIAAGAESLAVALVEEGIRLREAGIRAPILLLSEPPSSAMEAAIAHGLTPTLYSGEGVAAAAAAAARGADGGGVPVQVKVDTGMHRAGTDPDGLVAIVEQVLESDPTLTYQGLWTHLAVADEVADPFTELQLDRFEAALRALAARGVRRPPLLHAANSAGAIAHPTARYDMIRCGIALYGYSPAPEVTAALASSGEQLRPALSWVARVSHTQTLDEGERPSYGRRRPLPGKSVVATVPVGYHDGIPRRFLECGGEVLIGGVRRPLAGTVTMDQIVVDCGPADGSTGAPEVRRGDEVVLIGRQGDGVITADDWAGWLGTISYEVLTQIGTRVPRVVVGSEDG